MNFSDQYVINVISHKSPIAHICQFPDNDKVHFISISVNSELYEWMIYDKNKIKEISKCILERPSDEFLRKNGHKIMSNKGLYYKIMKIISFDNFLAVGYDDGLILVWNKKVSYLF